MQSSLSYAPSPSPWDAATLMQHTRVYSSADENLVLMYAQVATELVEQYLGRFLISRPVTWVASRDNVASAGLLSLMPWPWTTILQGNTLALPRPATAVTSVSVGIWGQADIALVAGTDFDVDTNTEPARLLWISNTYRQTLKDHLTVVFTSGYGSTISQIPTPILQAILLLTTALVENRGDSAPDLMSNAVMALLGPYRFYAFA